MYKQLRGFDGIANNNNNNFDSQLIIQLIYHLKCQTLLDPGYQVWGFAAFLLTL